MTHIYRWAICLIAIGTFLTTQAHAAPPHGHGGGSSVGLGFSFGGGSPGSGISIGVGNVPNYYNHGYYDRGYYGGDYNRGYYNRDYYGRGYYGGSYGGSGVYLGGGSRDFRWGIGVPFGYDDYDWYAPYYNHYHRQYYDSGSGYYQGSNYNYDEDNSSMAAQEQPPMENPPVPTAGQVARLTDEQLKMMIAVSIDGYSKDLEGFTTGAGWKKHFKLAELKAIVTKADAPDSASQELIAEIANKIDETSKDPAYEVITKHWGFQTLLVALKEYSLPPVKRQAHVLIAKTQTLKRSLDNLSTGGGWKTYLDINSLEQLLGDASNNYVELNKKLEKILARFDEVSQNPQYKAVADLQGFDVTHKALQQYVHTIQAEMAKPDTAMKAAENNAGEASL